MQTTRMASTRGGVGRLSADLQAGLQGRAECMCGNSKIVQIFLSAGSRAASVGVHGPVQLYGQASRRAAIVLCAAAAHYAVNRSSYARRANVASVCVCVCVHTCNIQYRRLTCVRGCVRAVCQQCSIARRLHVYYSDVSLSVCVSSGPARCASTCLVHTASAAIL